MKKSILTATLVAVFVLGVSDSEASWVFGKNNKQTAAEFLAAFGAVESELESIFDASKHLSTAINDTSKAGKPLKNFVKKLTDAIDAFRVKLAPNKLSKAVRDVGVASQSLASDTTIQQKKPILLKMLNEIGHHLDSIHKKSQQNGLVVQNGTVTCLKTLVEYIGGAIDIVNKMEHSASQSNITWQQNPILQQTQTQAPAASQNNLTWQQGYVPQQTQTQAPAAPAAPAVSAGRR